MVSLVEADGHANSWYGISPTNWIRGPWGDDRNTTSVFKWNDELYLYCSFANNGHCVLSPYDYRLSGLCSVSWSISTEASSDSDKRFLSKWSDVACKTRRYSGLFTALSQDIGRNTKLGA
jgi:hypothetical protein